MIGRVVIRIGIEYFSKIGDGDDGGNQGKMMMVMVIMIMETGLR